MIFEVERNFSYQRKKRSLGLKSASWASLTKHYIYTAVAQNKCAVVVVGGVFLRLREIFHIKEKNIQRDSNPQLAHPRIPYLYTVVPYKERAKHVTESPLGFRCSPTLPAVERLIATQWWVEN